MLASHTAKHILGDCVLYWLGRRDLLERRSSFAFLMLAIGSIWLSARDLTDLQRSRRESHIRPVTGCGAGLYRFAPKWKYLRRN